MLFRYPLHRVDSAVHRRWLRAGRPFRMIWWEQMLTQQILLPVVLDAFEAIAAKENAFAYPIEFLKLPK